MKSGLFCSSNYLEVGSHYNNIDDCSGKRCLSYVPGLQKIDYLLKTFKSQSAVNESAIDSRPKVTIICYLRF
jgi:hypothetical protein